MTCWTKWINEPTPLPPPNQYEDVSLLTWIHYVNLIYWDFRKCIRKTNSNSYYPEARTGKAFSQSLWLSAFPLWTPCVACMEATVITSSVPPKAKTIKSKKPFDCHVLSILDFSFQHDSEASRPPCLGVLHRRASYFHQSLPSALDRLALPAQRWIPLERSPTALSWLSWDFRYFCLSRQQD